MIGLDTARALLDLGTTRVAAHRAEEQLRGAVALHAMLSEHGVAYLADEVGMGKTYVALATLALFRHFDPTFRALVIAPRPPVTPSAPEPGALDAGTQQHLVDRLGTPTEIEGYLIFLPAAASTDSPRNGSGDSR